MPSKIINIKDKESWDAFRMQGGIGASEVASLLGYNQYFSALQLFHAKIGFQVDPFFSIKAKYGQITEGLSTEIWEAWEYDWETTQQNLAKGKSVRKCHKYAEFDIITNDAYPHLFCSPDRFTEGAKRIAVELKDTSAMALNVYKDKKPIPYVIQNKSQIMLGEFDEGELFFIVDRCNDAILHKIKRDGFIVDDITETQLSERATAFWETVIAGRQASEIMRVAKKEHDEKTYNEAAELLMQLEPEPDTTAAYEKYIIEKYLTIDRPVKKKKGTAKHHALAEKYIKTKERLKAAESDDQAVRNEILHAVKDGSEITLDGKGYIRVQQGKTSARIQVKL